MKHILIPTDFSIHSLNAVHAAMAIYSNPPVKITLLHLLRMPDAIPDILFRSIHNKHPSLITAEFREGCEILQNRYGSSLQCLNIKFGYGSTVNYLKNLLEGEKITDVLVCHDIQLKLPSARSIEMLSMLKRTGYNINTVSSKTRKTSHAMEAISRLMGEIDVPKTKTEEHHAITK